MIKVKNKNFKRLNKKEFIDWNKILENSAEATIFHTPEWVTLMVEELGAVCEVNIAYKDENPVGVYPYYIKKKKIFFRKATTGMFETPYGGPIHLNGCDNDVIRDLVKKQNKRLNIISSSIILPPFYILNSFLRSYYKLSEKQTIVLDLCDSEDELFLKLHQMKRRNIKKAIKNNVEIIEGNTKSIDDFHKMLEDTYNRLNLAPPKSLKFYKKLFDLLYPKKRIKMLIALYDGKPIASIILLEFNNTLIFWQGASYKEYMKYGPNDLLHWHAIKTGKIKGVKNYNLLHFHDHKGNELDSLKKFKLGFGGSLTSYYNLDKSNKFIKIKYI